MPDWFYRTVARPALFPLPAKLTRRFTLSCMGAGGVLASAGALGVYFAIGYVDFVHLLPAWMGLVLLIAGTALAWPWAASADQA